MWFRITDISVKQVDANHLENPRNAGTPMVLNFVQRESRTAFAVSLSKKAYPQYLEAPTRKIIPRNKWTEKMKTFAEQQKDGIVLTKGGIRITIMGWIIGLLVFGVIGYAVYETIQAPAKKKHFEQRNAKMATATEGDIYFGSVEVVKDTVSKGPFLNEDRDYGWLKVAKVENDIYYISKSVEMKEVNTPKEQLNNTDFETETIAVTAKTLEPYYKVFVSKDGKTKIYLRDKKETEVPQ